MIDLSQDAATAWNSLLFGNVFTIRCALISNNWIGGLAAESLPSLGADADTEFVNSVLVLHTSKRAIATIHLTIQRLRMLHFILSRPWWGDYSLFIFDSACFLTLPILTPIHEKV
ncbi:protein of unknown function [Paenibacillus alvei]|uniref:Uncharacterized protein n=1 Tax=Paenibacillus alvei TaxID=44250 RepID=A0A383RC54_PAEAL|nr:protein of unknown function [Paenibacillus alvei]